jgi:hypothetical protein
MNTRLKLKLAMWYLKYRKYVWLAVAVAALVAALAVGYFVWLR